MISNVSITRVTHYKVSAPSVDDAVDYALGDPSPVLASRCELLNEWRETIGHTVVEGECECELPGHFRSGLKGVLAHVEGQGVTKVERCDTCRRYRSDRDAKKALRAFLRTKAKREKRA